MSARDNMFELTPALPVSRCPKLSHHDVCTMRDSIATTISDPKDDWVGLQCTMAQKHGPMFVITKCRANKP
jgi:hypothetical protein